ncbi:MIP/aquaporin family protein [Rhabdaerophilum sp. SD176]|uniref:aquaporin n=1 Tax=Rhabdaerophilum sp. SD176 TaxID=2983548 RepID=UPI0024DFCA6A|nr:MIP/aquaporin family protein [Rhabdaerophilum sp. SD176]
MVLRARLFAEALGTALLVATVIGSGIMATQLSRDVGVQLMANALATGAMLVVLITMFGPVSGAHFNPVVSLVFMLRKELPGRWLAPYIAAQVLGGLAGTVAAHLMFGMAPLMTGGATRTGAALWFSEVVASFTLVLAILMTLRHKAGNVAVIVGLVITGAYWFTASTSFANPAVTLSRAFTPSFAGIALADVPAFMIMQAIGALAAWQAESWLAGAEETNDG